MKTKMKTYGLVLLFIFCIGICFNFNGIYANQNMNSSEITKKAKEMLGDENGDVDVTKLVTEYEELTKEYSNDEIADMIEENKDVLEKKGISSEAISAGTEVLRNMEPEKVTKILKEDIKIDDVKKKLDEGYTPSEVVSDVTKSLSTEEKISIGIKLLLANKIFKTTVAILGILLVYSIILRWIIFTKAGKHGFAAIIPIYRDVVYFKICSISPWVILFALLPIIGWIILAVIKIVSRFELSKNFGKKTAFGFGLWLLPVIFDSILAFSNTIKYSEEE